MAQIIINITNNEGTITVFREKEDLKFYGIARAAGESRFLYWLKNKLNNEFGFDLIKKRMYHDGHLVDEQQQYLRTRSEKSNGPKVMIYNNHWAIRGLEEDFNKGKVILSVVPLFSTNKM